MDVTRASNGSLDRVDVGMVRLANADRAETSDTMVGICH